MGALCCNPTSRQVGDMMAKYHTRYLAGLFNRARKDNLEGLEDHGQGDAASTSGIVFA